ncbi:MAG TPA: hypothetical protein VHC72_13420 [Bryobacteraceae bacterium]|nr:hypothetical protein [Bryobacteraceae bacterium]
MMIGRRVLFRQGLEIDDRKTEELIALAIVALHGERSDFVV